MSNTVLEKVKTAKHTPGPWEIVDARDGIAIIRATHLQITVDHRENFGPAQPDAKLIAAAPELLDALREVLAYMPDTGSPELLKQIRAAIRKATGE